MLVVTSTPEDENICALVGVEFVFYWCYEPELDSDTGDLQAPQTVAPLLREHVGDILYSRVARQPTASLRGLAMETICECCAGLDVHKKTVVACIITPDGEQPCTFSTMTKAQLELGDWLLECQVTHVAIESSGVFWKPIYNLLEGLEMTQLVVNARHMKAVPGGKTDVKDAEWIAQLPQHGLLRGSYIPDRPQRELRGLVRFRRHRVRQRAQVVNRVRRCRKELISS